MDGGSLGIVLFRPQGDEQYTLIRSIESHGTQNFERIKGENGLLSDIQERELGVRLVELAAVIPADSPCVDILGDFINVLRARHDLPTS
jgi:hypothetical protein